MSTRFSRGRMIYEVEETRDRAWPEKVHEYKQSLIHKERNQVALHLQDSQGAGHTRRGADKEEMVSWPDRTQILRQQFFQRDNDLTQ